MKVLTLIFVLVFPFIAKAQNKDICDLIDLPNCRGITKQLRRNTFQTAPTTSTASNLNPANVSFDRGAGLEVLYQPSNPLLYSIISGTGKMGGALISGSMDNTFFGNRTPELNETLLERYENKRQFKNKKLSLSVGGKVFSKKQYGLDAGLIIKRHPDVKDLNMGAGISGRLWFLHFGASFYRDDVFIDLTDVIESSSGLPYSVLSGQDSIEENFTVSTYTVGTRIKNFAFDLGKIKSTLDFYDGEPTEITIYSASFYYGDFLFNLAQRKESSNANVFNFDTELIETKKDKTETYFGIQYSVNKHIIFGVNYNYFMLREGSISATLFI